MILTNNYIIVFKNIQLILDKISFSGLDDYNTKKVFLISNNFILVLRSTVLHNRPVWLYSIIGHTAATDCN